jgi:hypothetical protein
MFFSDLGKTAVHPNINTFLDLDRHGLKADRSAQLRKGGHPGEGKSLEKEHQIITTGHCVNVCSVVDLDPDETAINFDPLDPDPHWECRPGSGIQERPTKNKKFKFVLESKNSIKIKHSGARWLPDLGGGQSCGG